MSRSLIGTILLLTMIICLIILQNWIAITMGGIGFLYCCLINQELKNMSRSSKREDKELDKDALKGLWLIPAIFFFVLVVSYAVIYLIN